MAKKKLTELLSSISPEVLEKPQKTGKKQPELFIGVPKEDQFDDNRVALSPSGVSLLISQGHEVLIESNAGVEAGFKDIDYSEAGAQISTDREKVFQADILLMVSPPSLVNMELMKHGQTLISPIHLPTLKEEYIRKLMSKKITAFAFEYIKDESGNFPFVRAMSEIAGASVIMIASELMNRETGGRGVLMGGITGVPPAKVIILGAGVVGQWAADAAIGLGAVVKVFDNNLHKLFRLQNHVGSRVFTSVVDPEVLAYELKIADVVIGAIHSEEGRAPVVVSEAMVEQMKEGAVIIDVSVDQGGCFATSDVTTHKKPTFTKHGVIHYCVPNIASRVSRTASYAISNILTSTMLHGADSGGLDQLIRKSKGARNGVYIYNGVLTNLHLGERFNIKSTRLDLLITSGF